MSSCHGCEPDCEPEPEAEQRQQQHQQQEQQLQLREQQHQRQQRLIGLNRYCNTSLTLDQWEFWFGLPTPECPWGEHLWPGMRRLLGMYNFRATGDVMASHFQLPLTFSKAAARLELDLLNEEPSGQLYPCYAWRWGQEDGKMKYKVACLWILVMNCRPWTVDESWLITFYVVSF